MKYRSVADLDEDVVAWLPQLPADLYPAPRSEHHVDFYFEIVATPRCFEWNLMHHPWVLSKTCMDIDGVLCRDPSPEENDDGAQYRQFLTSTERRYLPTAPVRWL